MSTHLHFFSYSGAGYRFDPRNGRLYSRNPEGAGGGGPLPHDRREYETSQKTEKNSGDASQALTQENLVGLSKTIQLQYESHVAMCKAGLFSNSQSADSNFVPDTHISGIKNTIDDLHKKTSREYLEMFLDIFFERFQHEFTNYLSYDEMYNNTDFCRVKIEPSPGQQYLRQGFFYCIQDLPQEVRQRYESSFREIERRRLRNLEDNMPSLKVVRWFFEIQEIVESIQKQLTEARNIRKILKEADLRIEIETSLRMALHDFSSDINVICSSSSWTGYRQNREQASVDADETQDLLQSLRTVLEKIDSNANTLLKLNRPGGPVLGWVLNTDYDRELVRGILAKLNEHLSELKTLVLGLPGITDDIFQYVQQIISPVAKE